MIQAQLAALEVNGSPPPIKQPTTRLKVNLGEALIELERYPEAEALLSGLLFDLKQLDDDEYWLLISDVFFATSGLARISHSQKQWKSAVDRWEQALELAESDGWSRQSRLVNLARLSRDDAAYNLGTKGGPAESKEEIADTLRLLERQPMRVEEPMFFHWEAFIGRRD